MMKKMVMVLLVMVTAVTVVHADEYKDAFTVYKEYLFATKSKNLGQVIERLDSTSPSYKAELKGVLR